jgi:hypothetical protein
LTAGHEIMHPWSSEWVGGNQAVISRVCLRERTDVVIEALLFVTAVIYGGQSQSDILFIRLFIESEYKI